MVWNVVRYRKQDWFETAARVLVEQGPGRLRVDALCQAAGMTKGSFYHHFRSLEDFTEAFLGYLDRRGAQQPLAELARVETPRARLQALVETVAAEDLALEAAIRRWAVTERAVAEHVARVDTARGELVSRLYQGLLPADPQQARDLTRLAQAFYLGAVLLDPPVQGDEYRRLARLLDRVLEGHDA